MGTRTRDTPPAPPLWEVPDDVWAVMAQIVGEHSPATSTGPRRVDRRRMLNGLIFRLRTGSQWTRRPPAFGEDRTSQRHGQRWG